MLMEQFMNFENTENITALATFIGAVVLCLSILKIAAFVGRYVNLVDRPTSRKLHVGNIPLVGGISIFLTFLTMQLVGYKQTCP